MLESRSTNLRNHHQRHRVAGKSGRGKETRSRSNNQAIYQEDDPNQGLTPRFSLFLGPRIGLSSTSGIMGCVGMIVRIVQSYNCVRCHVDAAGEELEGAGQRHTNIGDFIGGGLGTALFLVCDVQILYSIYLEKKRYQAEWDLRRIVKEMKHGPPWPDPKLNEDLLDTSNPNCSLRINQAFNARLCPTCTVYAFDHDRFALSSIIAPGSKLRPLRAERAYGRAAAPARGDRGGGACWFWTQAGNANANGLASPSARDATFFRADGAMTGYARGVLLANAAWAVWRGVARPPPALRRPCRGICGPRHRWEEEAHEKSTGAYADEFSADEPLPWRWREETAAHTTDAEADMSELLAGTTPAPTPGFEEMEQVMAAIGSRARRRLGGYPFAGPGAQMSSQDRVMVPFPSPGPPEAQGDTSGSLEEAEDEEDEDEDEDDEDLEEDEEEEEEEEEEEGLPGSEEPSSGRASGSMSSLEQPVTSRYPFQFRRPARSASASSHATHSTNANTRSTNTRDSTNTRGSTGAHSRLSQSTGKVQSSSSGQSPSSARTASSLADSSVHSANGNGNGRHHSAGAGIAMPPSPRHPQQGRGRSRAGTVPVPAGGVTRAFGAGPQPEAPLAEHELLQQGHGEEAALESEGSHEHAGEREDRVGLLSSRASNVSLGAHRRGYSHSRSNSRSNSHSGGGSGHHSRTQSSHSGSSHSRSRSRAGSVGGVRSRAQSLLQAVASHSSIELVQRLRANSSMARLEEDGNGNHSDAARTTTNTHSRSGSGTTSDAVPSSGGENNTFGHPLRTTWHNAPQQQEQQQSPPTPVEEEGSEEGREEVTGRLHAAQSRTSVFSAAPLSVLSSPSLATKQQASRAPSPERCQAESAGIPIPVIRAPPHDLGVSSPSSYGSETTYPDVSTAPQSFLTAAATIEGSTTESSGGRTDGLESWGVAAGGAHLRDASRGGGQGAWGHYGPV
ncbi:hypothetical protein B0H14DRAFT_2606026 [Mycena olivaceomarginata]|nr:hypothetical protein B0H14DRAFT_2606026 [Mycena olivaceomarginata]